MSTVTTRRPFLLPAALLLGGVGTVVLGFLYDVMFAGIPPQDAPPEVRARFDGHAALAAEVERFGLWIVAAGLAAFVAAWVLRRVR